MAYKNNPSLREYEGRAPKLANVPVSSGGTDSHDIAVFDRSRTSSPNGATRVGLGHAVLARSDAFLFHTTEADKKPAKVVPFHEPHPDRIAISDAIRARIEADERRAAESFAAYNETVMSQPKQKNGGRRSVPDVENPDTSLCCTEAEAGVKAEREGRVLYWRTVRDADSAFGGTKTARRVENALMPGKRLIDPYGWRWTKLGDARVRRRSGARHL